VVWRAIKLTRQHNYDGLSFRRSGLYWNSNFINNNRLEDYKHVEFHRNDENQYRLGFKFHHKPTKASLSLQKSGRDTNSKGRTVKASALRKINTFINAECKSESDPFEIFYDKFEQIFYVELRPNFANKIKFSDIDKLPKDLKGIYRYLDEKNLVIYIGKGAIRDRTQQVERKEWGIRFVEYAAIDSDKEAHDWESHYLDEFLQDNGFLPSFNRIRGQSNG